LHIIAIHNKEKMNYLAFDIEAANGYKPYSICSIGVVIADENLNIISQRNIWINPKTKYDLMAQGKMLVSIYIWIPNS
jgi:hypothetical protein